MTGVCQEKDHPICASAFLNTCYWLLSEWVGAPDRLFNLAEVGSFHSKHKKSGSQCCSEIIIAQWSAKKESNTCPRGELGKVGFRVLMQSEEMHGETLINATD